MDPRNGPLTWRNCPDCESGSCVETANLPENVLITHSSVMSVVRYTLSEWGAFIRDIKLGDFDALAKLS